jgi:hypothetical protein
MGHVAALILQSSDDDAGSPIEILSERLAVARAAESAARLEHGAACLARETGEPHSDVDATAARLAAAETARRNLEAAIEAAELAAQQSESERLAADDARRHAHADALLARREALCASLQDDIARLAANLVEALRLGAQAMEALPRRPQYPPTYWALPQSVQLALYAATDGALAARGVIDSPFTVRQQRPDLKAQAAADREFLMGWSA